MMERDLLGQLKQNLEAKFDFKSAKKIKHVDEMDLSDVKANMKGMDFGSMHKVHPDTVEYKDKYVNNYSATRKPKVTASDPYTEIHGGRYAGR